MNKLIIIPNVLYGQEVVLDREINNPNEVKIIVTTLIHELNNQTIPAVESYLNQTNQINSIMLIIDDGTSNISIDEENVYVVKIPKCNVARGRNFANEICRRIFPDDSWVCRLDADDTFYSKNTLDEIYQQIMDLDIEWALAGNDLKLSGQKIQRDNPVNAQFLNKQYITSRLKGMAEGDVSSELPSCNLWKKNAYRAYYPEIASGEDHWLVAKLLLKHQNCGLILNGTKYANYHLQGENTRENKKSGRFVESRKSLYNSFNEDTTVEKCLDWGLEGMIFTRGDEVIKKFYNFTITDEQVKWLKSIPNAPILDVKWEKLGDLWAAKSKLQLRANPDEVTREQISKFITSCLENRIVFLNVNRENMFIDQNSLLKCLDIGTSIVPFKPQFFRDMCLRLFACFVLKISDSDLSKRTLIFRNNIEEMKKYEGFEDFYSREMQLYNLNRGFFRKPARDMKEEKSVHENTTLMIKTCAMDHKLIQRQVQHIIRQITKFDDFNKTVLLIDPKQVDFLRQHEVGDLEKLMIQAKKLKEETWIDEIIIAPNENKNIVSNCLENWFDLKSSSTHTTSGVPLFPQLWGFEQISTRYVLQMDCDVMLHCSTNDGTITKMHEAICSEKTFGVGFNIPQPKGVGFNQYQGSFVPEVRCGLFDLERMIEERPFPNNLKGADLQLSWYRSIEQFQEKGDWQSLRGGFSSTYYIHPMNSAKQNISFYDRCIDLVEQGHIPIDQRGNWDLIEEQNLWQYQERKENIVFYIHTQEPIQHFLRGLVVSIAKQINVDAGLIIYCDETKSNRLDWLLELKRENPGKITIVRKRFSSFSISDISNLNKEICGNDESKIIQLHPKEILFDERVAEELVNLNGKQINLAAHLVHRPLGIDSEISNYKPDTYSIATTGIGQSNNKNTTSMFTIINYDRSISQVSENDRRTNYIPNVNKLEIDITYFCNLTCSGCSRSSAQAPSNMHMPVSMIQDFLDDSAKKGKLWESIHILGGEPTLHPNFVEIITMIDDWLEKHSPDTERKVISNGISRKTMKNLSLIPKRWRYDNSFKHDREAATQHFEPFNYAPKDLANWRNQDFTKGCYITQDSGIGLSPYGYHHCAIAGGIERIFNFGLGFDELPEHPWQFLDMMKTYCSLCGHFLSDIPLERAERSEMKIDPGIQSISWQNGYSKWEVNGDA